MIFKTRKKTKGSVLGAVLFSAVLASAVVYLFSAGGFWDKSLGFVSGAYACYALVLEYFGSHVTYTLGENALVFRRAFVRRAVPYKKITMVYITETSKSKYRLYENRFVDGFFAFETDKPGSGRTRLPLPEGKEAFLDELRKRTGCF